MTLNAIKSLIEAAAGVPDGHDAMTAVNRATNKAEWGRKRASDPTCSEVALIEKPPHDPVEDATRSRAVLLPSISPTR